MYVHDRVSGETSLVSKSTAGTAGDRAAHRGSVSDDGRYVVFDSASTNLASEDTDGAGDVFVHDRESGETKLVSGAQSGDCENAHVSGDGALVAYGLNSFDLVVHDVVAGTDRSLEKFSGGSVDFSSDDHLITYSTDERALVVLNLVGGKRELFE
jgi:tricorn protease-like protein